MEIIQGRIVTLQLSETSPALHVCLSNQNDSLLAIYVFPVHFQKICQCLLLVIVEKLQDVIRLLLRDHSGVGNCLEHVQFVVAPLEFNDNAGAFLVHRQQVDSILDVLRWFNILADEE